MLPAFKGGLSSRTVVGESGPIHLVKSSLETDARLVPLYRYMCEHCDREASLAGGGGSGGGEAGHNHNHDVSEAEEAEKVLRAHFAQR